MSIWKVPLLPVAKGEGGRSAASLGFWYLADFGRRAVLLTCPWAEISPGAVGFRAAQLPGCSFSGAGHTLLQTLLCHGRAESQRSLPPLLAAVVVAALGHPAGFVLSVGLRAQPWA